MTLYAVAVGTLSTEWFYVPLAQYAVTVLARLTLSLRFGYRLVDSFLHPLSIGYMIAVAINSMLWSLQGKGSWKGRAAVQVDHKPRT